MERQGEAEAAVTRATVWAFPCSIAACSTVVPSLAVAEGFAPAPSSIRAMSCRPIPTATCSGVCPAWWARNPR